MKKPFYGLLALWLGWAVAMLPPTARATADNYLSPSVIEPQFLPPPAPVHSPQWNAQIQTIIDEQAHPDRQEWQAAIDEQRLRPELLTAVLGSGLSRERFPKTFALLDKVGGDCGTAMENAKNFWDTQRPFAMDKRIRPPFPGPTNGAYPSGHTACSLVWAETLGQILPKKRDALLARAYAIAEHRILAGVHYPDDIAGGRALGYMIFGALQQNPAYLHDLDAAGEEWKKH